MVFNCISSTPFIRFTFSNFSKCPVYFANYSILFNAFILEFTKTSYRILNVELSLVPFVLFYLIDFNISYIIPIASTLSFILDSFLLLEPLWYSMNIILSVEKMGFGISLPHILLPIIGEIWYFPSCIPSQSVALYLYRIRIQWNDNVQNCASKVDFQIKFRVNESAI